MSVARWRGAACPPISPGMRTHTALGHTTTNPDTAPAPRTQAVTAWMARLLAPWRRRPPAPLTLVLRKYAAASVTVRRVPLTVRCVEGFVWVTHDANPGDHVLGPGERFVASGRGHLVVLALAPKAIAAIGREEPPRAP